MPVHIEELSAEVVLHSGEVPLTAEQLDLIADHVLRRLAERRREESRSRRADAVRGSALPKPLGGGRS
ncbi:hypothetical protein ACI78V_09295 [Geodermatophilus sp. SYSU D00742]